MEEIKQQKTHGISYSEVILNYNQTDKILTLKFPFIGHD